MKRIPMKQLDDRFGVARRRVLLSLAALPLGTVRAAAGKTSMEVWKDPNCGCCKNWGARLEAGDFTVKTHDTGNSAIRHKLGMPVKYGACHTAIVDAYVIKGHVPARAIHRLLKEKPNALGLAVPGMPAGSPGMDGAAYGGRKDAYDVLLVARDGTATVFHGYR